VRDEGLGGVVKQQGHRHQVADDRQIGRRSDERRQKIDDVKNDAGIRRFDVFGVGLKHERNLTDEPHLSKYFDVELPERMVVPEQDGTGLEDGLHAVGALLVVNGGRILAPHLPAAEDGLEETDIADQGLGVVAELENGPLLVEGDDWFGEAVLEEDGNGVKAGAAIFAAQYARQEKDRLLAESVAENVVTGKHRSENDVEGGSDAGVVQTEFDNPGK
jgi:hypothetical protein